MSTRAQGHSHCARSFVSACPCMPLHAPAHSIPGHGSGCPNDIRAYRVCTYARRHTCKRGRFWRRMWWALLGSLRKISCRNVSEQIVGQTARMPNAWVPWPRAVGSHPRALSQPVDLPKSIERLLGRLHGAASCQLSGTVDLVVTQSGNEVVLAVRVDGEGWRGKVAPSSPFCGEGLGAGGPNADPPRTALVFNCFIMAGGWP